MMIEKSKVLDYISQEIQMIQTDIIRQQSRVNDLVKQYVDYNRSNDDYVYIDDPMMNAMLMEGL